MSKTVSHIDPKQMARIDWTPKKTYIRELGLPRKKSYWVTKRFMDVLFSLLILIVLSPLYLLIMLAIVIDDPKGGPFYSQMRCGRGGKPFRMYKFRSMHVGADQMLKELKSRNEMRGPVFKMKNDPRITRVGKVLRKVSLDELPQFYNVLKGDMTIVGPRPPLPAEVADYNEYQFQRLFVTPGLTCYWQIAPHRNSLSFDEWLELDIQYVIERTLWVDIKIIFKTVLAMLHRSGE